MLPLQCPYCEHANPNGASYCNACGSRLLLKMCNQCEAVNDQAVRHCYECGREFPVSSTTAEAAARAACERLQQLLRNGRRVAAPPPTPAASTTWRQDSSLPIQIPRGPGSKTAQVAILSTVLLSAVVASAYYLYRHPVHLAELLSAKPSNSAAAVDVNAGPAPSHPVLGGALVSSSTQPPTARDTFASAAIEALGLASPVAPSTDATTLPMTQGSTRAISSDGVEQRLRLPHPIPAAAMPRAPGTTSDQAPPASPFTARIKGPGKAPPPPLAVEPRQETMRATMKQVVPADPVANRSTPAESAPVQSPPTHGGASDPPAGPRPRICTEAVAAAGLCNPQETMRATMNQVVPTDPVANRSTPAESAPIQSPPAHGGASDPPAGPRPGICTEAVAAAGLCNLSSKEGSD
jgi:Double zinc ribbon